MNKLNKAGFTLIELLAVITIMGILMMVAIPSVSRTIENSRRDTFADNALTYINTIRNAVLADEVKCDMDTSAATKYVTASGTPNGDYYFVIDTTQQQTKDIMEKVATSSWGGNDLKGYVKWSKKTNADGRTTTTYYVRLADAQGHGIGNIAESGTDTSKTKMVSEKDVTRSSVVTSGAVQATVPTGTVYECILK